jgi:hypothetical protein
MRAIVTGRNLECTAWSAPHVDALDDARRAILGMVAAMTSTNVFVVHDCHFAVLSPDDPGTATSPRAV